MDATRFADYQEVYKLICLRGCRGILVMFTEASRKNETRTSSAAGLGPSRRGIGSDEAERLPGAYEIAIATCCDELAICDR